MPLISVLSAEVADQIAAGEVVERPASVVKELVENALDGGASTIDITIEEGGHRLIRVSDDGCGMDREDASLALVRHGTSKIRTAADLVGVASYGFRGEALPAIASISQLEIETSPADGAGVSLTVSSGSATATRDAARRRGTTVSVARLFHNVPARRKFLRSARSEWRAITESVVAIALTRPDVRFNLSHDGRPLGWEVRGSASRRGRCVRTGARLRSRRAARRRRYGNASSIHRSEWSRRPRHGDRPRR